MNKDERDGHDGLTDDELRVMGYFAKNGGDRTMEEIVNSVERYLFNMDALFNPNEDLYCDRADIEAAVRSLVVKGLLKDVDSGNETIYRAKMTQTHVRNRVSVAGARTRQFLPKLVRVWKLLAVGLGMAAAVVTIMGVGA